MFGESEGIMDYNESLVKGSVAGSLIGFAVPIFLTNALQMLYSATDILVLANFSTNADVSGATIGSQVVHLITLAIIGLSIGLTVTLGHFSGAKSTKDLAGAIGTAIIFFSGIAFVLMMVMLLSNSAVINVMDTPPEAIGAASSYFMICSLGIFFIIWYNVTASIFRGLGDSKPPLLFGAIACVINVVLDLLFVVIFGFGAGGAAAATVIAQGCSVFFALVYIKRRSLGFTITLADIRFRWQYVRRMFKIGAPISFQEVTLTISFILITIIANRMGVNESASVGIVEKLVGFLMMPSLAMASAVAAMSAHNIGAGEMRRAEKCMWTAVGITLTVAVPICVVTWFAGWIPISVFTRDPYIVPNAVLYLRTYSLDCICVCFVWMFNAYFTSCNRSLFAMLHSLFATFFIRIPVVLFIAGIPGATLFDIGLAMPLSTLGSIIVCIIYFYYLKSKKFAYIPPVSS